MRDIAQRSSRWHRAKCPTGNKADPHQRSLPRWGSLTDIDERPADVRLTPMCGRLRVGKDFLYVWSNSTETRCQCQVCLPAHSRRETPRRDQSKRADRTSAAPHVEDTWSEGWRC